MIKSIWMALIAIVLCATACQETVFTPKPRGYPKVEYPQRNYKAFDADYCNFTFQYPDYARIVQDTSYFEQQPVHPCWFDLYMESFDCRLHCSYYPVGEGKTFEELKNDAFEMVEWHNKKAIYIDERKIRKPGNVSGFTFEIEGPVASPFQFYLTDSTEHFVRGSLYFNTKARPDSLAPVYDFVKEDIYKMIDSFEWGNQSQD